ncbi:MAG: hypothetical protein IV100_10055 [Myxococcales bacterium]|nr:hypothetical protein [Myxococcales bacterium]
MVDRSRLIALAFTLSMALSLTGCGGDATGPSSSAPDTVAPADTSGGETQVGFDTPSPMPDGAASEISQPDTTELPTADFGEPCAKNEDCVGGYCVDGFEGSVCTDVCLDGCPDGWACRSVANAFPDIVFVCVPISVRLCQPCTSNVQCGGGECRAIGGDSFCTTPCNADVPCPTGFECLIGEAGSASYCAPASGSCECTAASEGQVRPCEAINEYGKCLGFETCNGAAGYGPCSAATPALELCDGLDNNCNGQYDEGSADGDACTVTNDVGTCTGVRTCLGAQGEVCSARTPAAESCNYLDDDCDGQTDEDMKQGEFYAAFDHCGACGQSCKNGFPNATARCGTEKTPPQCVVEQCDPGTFPLNEYQCVPFAAKVCEACVTDENCGFPGSRCVELADGKFCGQACAVDSECPSGYVCQSPDGGSLQCVPETGACSCDGTNTNLQRACDKTFQSPEPGSPLVVCPGTEYCQAEGWSGCQVPADACDGADNDCDGTVDGPWVDGSGRYVTSAHCGACGNNCAAAQFANGTGACMLAGVVPVCALECLPGFADVNSNDADGCECQFLGSTDEPDGVDQNCDGVDGEIGAAVFVAKNGSANAAGTIDAPLLTIQQGIDKAAATGKRDVYVATGVYPGDLLLAAGVRVYGGYRGDFLARNTVLYETAVLGSGTSAERPAAVNAVGIAGQPGDTRFDGFSIFGADTSAAGQSSYAVMIVDSTVAFSLSGCRIFAGDGGDGTPGSAGVSGATGVVGGDGLAVADVGKVTCTGNRAGGGGGQRQCGGGGVSGGAGGSAICPDFDSNTASPDCPDEPFSQSSTAAELGKAGLGPSPGAGGPAGFDGYIDRYWGPYNNYNCFNGNNANCGSCQNPAEGLQGAPGAPGSAGGDGATGAGCSGSGSVVNNRFQPDFAAGGGNGSDGSGGGGGGAGGGVETLDCQNQSAGHSDFGGSGGGGGSGGCGATGGTPGQGGGGSFAVFVSFSSPPASLPILGNNTVQRGRGGHGGFGGAGGTGGAAGPGGKGGATNPGDATFCAGGGGPGGAGGNGGHGGGGGGGCGGPSFAIFVSGAAGDPAWTASTTLLTGGGAGQGGPGGPSIGQVGTAGASGVFAVTNF